MTLLHPSLGCSKLSASRWMSSPDGIPVGPPNPFQGGGSGLAVVSSANCRGSRSYRRRSLFCFCFQGLLDPFPLETEKKPPLQPPLSPVPRTTSRESSDLPGRYLIRSPILILILIRSSALSSIGGHMIRSSTSSRPEGAAASIPRRRRDIRFVLRASQTDFRYR